MQDEVGSVAVGLDVVYHDVEGVERGSHLKPKCGPSVGPGVGGGLEGDVAGRRAVDGEELNILVGAGGVDGAKDGMVGDSLHRAAVGPDDDLSVGLEVCWGDQVRGGFFPVVGNLCEPFIGWRWVGRRVPGCAGVGLFACGWRWRLGWGWRRALFLAFPFIGRGRRRGGWAGEESENGAGEGLDGSGLVIDRRVELDDLLLRHGDGYEPLGIVPFLCPG